MIISFNTKLEDGTPINTYINLDNVIGFYTNVEQSKTIGTEQAYLYLIVNSELKIPIYDYPTAKQIICYFEFKENFTLGKNVEN